MNYLSPSILAADFSRLGEQVQIVDQAGAQYLHIDVMDGKFVPSISFGMPVIKSLRSCTDMFFDVHLMIEDPMRYVDDFVDVGADMITVHAESCRHLDRVVYAIKAHGIKVGVALNPHTPLSVLDYILPELDMVLIMTVNPGYGGQQFIGYTMQKIRDLRNEIEERGLNVDIEVDGGVTLKNLEDVLDAGANVIVAGSAIFKNDIGENVANFLRIMNH